MNKKVFEHTFSAVRASDELRLEVMNMIEKDNIKRKGAVLPKLVLVAAIISLLATTAFAAPTIISAIRGSRAEYLGGGYNKAEWMPGNDLLYDLYEIWVEVDVDPDAPEDIETYYLPQVPEGYVQSVGYETDIEALFEWTMGTGNRADEISYSQWPGAFFADRDILWSISVPEGTEPQKEMAELGGKTGYLIESSDVYGSRSFFWSDGKYVFRLTVPDEYTDEQLSQLIQSIHSVANIKPYIFKK